MNLYLIIKYSVKNFSDMAKFYLSIFNKSGNAFLKM